MRDITVRWRTVTKELTFLQRLFRTLFDRVFSAAISHKINKWRWDSWERFITGRKMITCAARIRAIANNLIFILYLAVWNFQFTSVVEAVSHKLGTTRSGYKGCFKINMEPRGQESEVRDDISSPNFRFAPSFMAVDAKRYYYSNGF